MHELSYLMKFITLARQQLTTPAPVAALVLEIGEMTGVLPEYLKRYYPEAVKGTVFEGSELVVELVPAETECLSCGQIYHPHRDNGYRCPACKSADGRILRGRELVLKEIRVLL